MTDEDILLAWYDQNIGPNYSTGNPDGDAFLRRKWLADIQKHQPDAARRIIARQAS